MSRRVFLPTWQIFEALGIYFLFSCEKKHLWSICKLLIGLLFLFNVAYYAYNYFVHTNSEYSKYWQYGYKQTIDYTKKYALIDKKIFFANDIEQGYMFYLFYNKYDPQKYISENGSNRINSACYNIDNAYFGVCKDMIGRGDIYVTAKLPSSNFKIIKVIKYPDNESAVWILEHL